jgi:uncharacterized membrane-anchored protein
MTARSIALLSTALLLLQPAFADPKPADPAQPAAATAATAAPAAAPDAATAPAADDTAAPAPDGGKAAEPSAEEKLASSFVKHTGTVELPGGKARVVVGDGFAFLDAGDTAKLLTQLWGNPPDQASGVLGAIIPANVDVLNREFWAAILTYEDDGHVADDDAKSINYDDLLKQMREGEDEDNAARKKAGYDSVKLVGWAQEPKYDSTEHKLYWAKHLLFGKDIHTLNYAIRALGRGGVLQVNVVAGMEQLKEINEKVPGMVSMVAFTDGNKYAEYDSSTDKLAAYGLAGLIAGGVAAKAGLFKVLLGLLVASWKIVAVGVVAVGAALRGFVARLFGGRSNSDT